MANRRSFSRATMTIIFRGTLEQIDFLTCSIRTCVRMEEGIHFDHTPRKHCLQNNFRAIFVSLHKRTPAIAEHETLPIPRRTESANCAT